MTIGSILSTILSPVNELLGRGNAPSVDIQVLGKTGSVSDIVSFIHANPEHRGTIETTMASSGRSGDLSIVIERSGISITLGQQPAAAQAGAGGGGAGPAQTMVSPQPSGSTSLAGPTTATTIAVPPANTSTAPANGAAAVPTTTGVPPTVAAQAATTAAITPNAAAQQLADPAQRPLGMAGQPVMADGKPALAALPGADAGQAATRLAADVTGLVNAASIATAIRAGQLPQLIVTALQEGRLDALVTTAKDAGQLQQLVAATRIAEPAIAAFAARGGVSATEVALMVRVGMLADPAALTTKTPAVLDPSTMQLAGLDAPAAFAATPRSAAIDEAAIAVPTDAALALFRHGAIRIVSREAVDVYGVLGPPGSLVIPADAFEGALGPGGGDRLAVERTLGLRPGTLGAADTLVALIEVEDLANLRLPADGATSAADWLPGGGHSGALAAGFADLHVGVAFREVLFAREGA